MTIRVLALLMIAALGAPAGSPEPQIGIYYSFDIPPSPAVFEHLQSGLAKILSPADLQVEWHQIGTPPVGFPEIFVIRFHGNCSPPEFGNHLPQLQPAESSLASTSISNGRVLPFAEIRCDLLRRYLGSRSAVPMPTFANALARLTAHELFHMLTRSPSHAHTGIAKPEYSRQDLLSFTLPFGNPEADRLRLLSLHQ
jgi:hypothetical protein